VRVMPKTPATPKTGSERTAAWRQSLIAKGYKQKIFLLSPAALAALAKAGKKHGSETAAVEAWLTGKDRP